MNNLFDDIKAVAFDLDGTLADTAGDLADAANSMRHSLNLPPLKEEVLLSFIGDGIGRLVHRALTDSHDSFAEHKLWEKGFSLYVKHYAAHITDRSKLYPQVADTLALLKIRQLPLALVTNKSIIFAKEVVKNLKIDQYFSLMIGGDSLSEKKPSAIPLLHVCESFNIQSNQLLMVGDSINDILAARNAQAKVIGVSFGYGNMQKLAQDENTRPDKVISNFGEIYNLLNN